MDNTRFDDELQRIFDEMLHSYLRPSTYNPHNRHNSRTDTTPQRDSGHLEYLRMLNDTISSYNSNMYHYQSNMQTYLQIVQTMTEDRAAPSRQYYAPPPPRTFRQNTIPIPNTSRATATSNAQRGRQNNQTFRDSRDDTTHLFSYLIYPIGDLSGNFIRTNPLRDVLVTPTQDQIYNATLNYSYDNELQLTNISCPITLEDFQQGDNVRQIRHCGHTFREPAIQNWFRQNVRCPVCRYDIRDYVAPSQQEDEEQEEEASPMAQASPIHSSASPDLSNNVSTMTSLQNIETELVRNITQSINSLLNNAMFSDLSNNFMHEFEFPIHTTDPSENSLDIDPVD